MPNELVRFQERFPEFKDPSLEHKKEVASSLRNELIRRKKSVVRKLEKLIDYSEDGDSTTFFIDLPSGQTIAEAYLRKINSDSMDLQQISVGKIGNSTDFFRDLGIGTMFLRKIFDYCIKKGIKKLNLKVDLTNLKALRLYEKLGFMVTRTDSRFLYLSKEFNH